MDLINQGLNLLSTGMITVFFFLFLIILLINLISLFTSSINSYNQNNDINPNDCPTPDEHKKIIEFIGKKIYDN